MAKINKIGIPRGLLYFRYGFLWESFFHELNIDVLLSPHTDRAILEKGTALCIDEACLSLKIFMGHVDWLTEKCDCIFIPRISSFSRQRHYCTRFDALYDVCQNLFRNRNAQFLTCNIDYVNLQYEEPAFLNLGSQLGFHIRESHLAYRRALKKYRKYLKALSRSQDMLMKSENHLRILLTGHSYLLDDNYIGKVISDYFQKNGVTVIRADWMDRTASYRAGMEVSPTCRWEMNAELIGATMRAKSHVHGVVILSAFPCGPDSMTNEILQHHLGNLPVLKLVLDGQSGNAGIETRLESFLDIIRFKEGLL